MRKHWPVRIAIAVLIGGLSWIQRRSGILTTYKVANGRAAASFEGAWFSYHPQQFGATGNIDLAQEAENETREALFDRLNGKEVFYDIGAHGGVYSITLLHRFPDAIVHSFEPQPEDLLANLELNGLTSNVHCVAVGDKSGEVQMTTHARSSNHVSATGSRSVRMVTLDDYALENDLPLPTWIKIDIEGLELPALRGAERLLRHGRPTIICEINHLYSRFGTSISEFLGYMRSLGYEVHRLHSGQLEPLPNARSFEELGYSADWNFWFVPERGGAKV